MTGSIAKDFTFARARLIDKVRTGQESFAMNCPACAAPLESLPLEGMSVDICRHGCGGIFFDNFELARVDQSHEKLGDALATLESHPAAVVVREKRPCPKCMGFTMLQHKFSREKPVLVDECPNCAGIWLDGGELAEIRRPVETVAERRKATQQFFSSLVSRELAQLRANRASS
jgi:Zn-finger nucleic acid-binding protein